MQLLNYFGSQLNFDIMPSESQLRIKELLLILSSVNRDLQEANESSITKKDSEIRGWVEELVNLVGSGQHNVFACELLIQQAQALINEKQPENTSLSSEASAEIFKLIEQYQKSPNPSQWTNFGDKVYYESRLSSRIELLYQIGRVANIIAPNETFDSSTRVTKVTQEVCNKVCCWIETYLQLNIKYINVYEPFVEEYKKYVYERPGILKEIGTRSGILPEEFLDNNKKISVTNAKLVIDWISTNLEVELPFPEKCELKPELINPELINKVPDKKLPNLMGIVSILILAAIPLSFIFFQVYQQLVEQPALILDEALPKQEIKKQAIPLKPTQ